MGSNPICTTRNFEFKYGFRVATKMWLWTALLRRIQVDSTSTQPTIQSEQFYCNIHSLIAQVVLEHDTFNIGAAGSSPAEGT